MSNSNLEDEAALRKLVSIYCSAVDDRDGARMASLFKPAGALIVFAQGTLPGVDTPLRTWTGAAGFAKLIATLEQTYATWIHFVGNHWANVNGDEAEGETYCLAAGATRADSENGRDGHAGAREELTFFRYKDSFIRTSAGWRFNRRLACKQWETVTPITAVAHKLDTVLLAR